MNVIPCAIAGDMPSRNFSVRADSVMIPTVETPPMDADERQRIAAEYAALPAYCHIYDVACMHLHYAQLTAPADANVEITVQASEEIQTFQVHPVRRGIAAQAQGRTLAFTADMRRPRYFIVRINQLPPLMIVIDEPEAGTQDPSRTIDASTFLTDATGASDQTENFHHAFAAAIGTGCTLNVPAGTYLVDQLHIQGGKNFTIRLAPGCLIKVRPSPPGENAHHHGLWLQDCEDVALVGRGCIDHQAYEHYAHGRNNYQHGMEDYYTSNELCPWITQSPLFITGCRRVLVEGITLRNGRNFNVNARATDDLTIRNVKILTPPACTPEYADGINTGSCRNVLVENCLVACNDDCFASGHYFDKYDSRPSANHVIRGMLGWNMRANGVRLGYYAGYDQGDFTFENCDFVGMPCAGLVVHGLRRGRQGRYGKIRMIDCGIDAPRLDWMLQVDKASLRSLELHNVSFHDLPATKQRMHIEGDPATPIERFEMEDVYMNGERVTSLNQLAAKIENVSCSVCRT